MTTATVNWERDTPPDLELRLLAGDLRRFLEQHRDEIPTYVHQVASTANMVDVIADRIERRESWTRT
jgi:hypothetical protein